MELPQVRPIHHLRMKVANLFFTIIMALYFTMGSYNSLFWSDLYYTVFVGYLFCCVLIDKKLNEDKLVGLLISGGIWLLYLVRPITIQFYYEWTRFAFGCMIGILGVFYLIYTIIFLLKKYL